MWMPRVINALEQPVMGTLAASNGAAARSWSDNLNAVPVR